MKQLGKIICIAGSLAAILFPPYRVFGDLHWNFIFGNLVKVKGIGSAGKIIDMIDYKTLIIELIIINAIGLILIYAKAKKKKRRR